MAEVFKGLNIEFGADDSGFNKSLTRINKELRSMESYGKTLDKALSFDNAEDGVKQLTKQLTVQEKILQGQKSKTKALTDEYSRLSKLSLNDLTNSQKKLKDEISDSEKTTKELEKELKQLKKAGEIDTDNFNNLQQELKNSKEKTKELKEELKGVGKDIKAIEPANMIKLADNIEKTEQATKKTSDKIKELKNNIKNVENGEFEKLSQEVKKTDKNIQQLDESSSGIKDSLGTIGESGATEALSSLTEGAGGAGTAIGGLGEIISSGTALLNPYTAAAIGVGVALKTVMDRAKDTREIQKTLNSSINDTGNSFKSQIPIVKQYARIMGVDVTEAAETAREVNQDFGSAIQSNGDLLTGMIGAQALANTGTFEMADAYRAASANSANFDDNLNKNTESISKSVFLMQSYGDRADDIIDTQQEWGDTFASTGQSSDQMFNILNAGLAAGARNTDEVANAWNEFMLRLGDGTAQESIEAIGLNYGDLTKQFDEGGVSSQQAFVKVIAGLFGVEDQTKRTALAASIFGTQGEEFISTLNTSTKELNKVSEGLSATKLKQDALNTVVGGSNEMWKRYAEQNNLTSIQVENLKNKIKEQGLSAAEGKDNSLLYSAVLQEMGKQAGLSQAQIIASTQVMNLYNGKTKMAQISNEQFVLGLKALQSMGILTDTSVKILTSSFKRYREEGISLTAKETQKLQENTVGFMKTIQASPSQINIVKESIATLGSNTSTSSEKVKALGNVVQVAGKSSELSATKFKRMEEGVRTLGDSSSSADKKTQALKTIINGLGDAGIINSKKAKNYSDSIDALSKATSTGTTKQDGLKNKFSESQKAMNQNKKMMEEMMKVQIASMNVTQQQSVKVALGTKRFNELTGATEKTKKKNEETKKATDDLKNSIDSVDTGNIVSELGLSGKAADEAKKSLDKTKTSASDLAKTPTIDLKTKTNATDTCGEIKQTKSWWDSWNPLPKILQINQKENRSSGGNSGGNSGGKSGRSRNLNNTTISPNITVNVNGGNNDYVNGQNIAKIVNKELYKMGRT